MWPFALAGLLPRASLETDVLYPRFLETRFFMPKHAVLVIFNDWSASVFKCTAKYATAVREGLFAGAVTVVGSLNQQKRSGCSFVSLPVLQLWCSTL